jgi:hypothetical protein
MEGRMTILRQYEPVFGLSSGNKEVKEFTVHCTRRIMGYETASFVVKASSEQEAEAMFYEMENHDSLIWHDSGSYESDGEAEIEHRGRGITQLDLTREWKRASKPKALCVPTDEGVFVHSHIHPLTFDLDSLHPETHPLLFSKLTFCSNLPVRPEDALPRKSGQRLSSKQSCDAAMVKWIARSQRNTSVGRNPSFWDRMYDLTEGTIARFIFLQNFQQQSPLQHLGHGRCSHGDESIKRGERFRRPAGG